MDKSSRLATFAINFVERKSTSRYALSMREAAIETRKDVAAAKSAACVLRARILSGALTPGTPLREAALIGDLGISRNTLREAFVQLTLEGLTEQQLYKGTVVRRIEADEIRDIFVARRALEFHAIDQSCYAAADALRAVRDAVERGCAAAARQAWADAGMASLEFHQAVVALLGSRRLDATFEVLSAQLRLAFAAFADEAEFQSPWIGRDTDLCEMLLRGRRQEARMALERYLDDSERSLLDALRSDRSRDTAAAPVGHDIVASAA